MSYLLGAYLILWAIVFWYIWLLGKRQQQLLERLKILEGIKENISDKLGKTLEG